MRVIMTTIRLMTAFGIAATLAVAACSASDKQESGDAAAAPPDAAAPGGPFTPDAGGKVITVQMETKPDGSNVFEPANIEAKRGDVIRYTLVAGVHNADFVADSNPGKNDLPVLSPLLQLPGQAYDVKVNLPPGSYYFHCDPHSLLGMKGQLTVLP
jgi:plastocyanin